MPGGSAAQAPTMQALKQTTEPVRLAKLAQNLPVNKPFEAAFLALSESIFFHPHDRLEQVVQHRFVTGNDVDLRLHTRNDG